MIYLTIIILSFNTKALLSSCVASILMRYKEELRSRDIELLIFDNNSTDGSKEYIRTLIEKTSGIRAVFSEQNEGFTRGNNMSAKHARGEYLLFLNSDTEVLNKRFFDMVEFLKQNKNVGVLGGKMKNADGTNQPSAGHFLNIFNVFLMLMGTEKIGLLRYSPSKNSPVDWVSGGFMMMEKHLFEECGKFDEEIFMYMEDMEFCYRVKKLGKQVYFYPHAYVLHKGQGSSSRSFAVEQIYRGLLYFYKKHKNYIQYVVVKALLISKAFIAIIIGMFTRNNYLTSTYRRALSLSL